MLSVRERRAQFEGLLASAEECLSRGELEGAAGLARMAAARVFPGHIGIFASPRLERLLLSIGKRVRAPRADPPASRQARARRVLHVLTYARPLGGDTRFAWRWMGLDEQSEHSVAVTSQAEVAGIYELPPPLVEAVARSGGTVHVLESPVTRPLAAALELRQLCQRVDVVVLHLYPHDVVPLLALAAECLNVRVAVMGHADHTFWLGGSVADLVVHFRDQSVDFLRRRRGLVAERSLVLPIPIAPPDGTARSREAKRALGYGDDIVLLLTIASAFKYEELPGHLSFLDLVEPVVVNSPRAVLLAVGPADDGAWQAARVRTQGRIRALGTRWDNDALYAAADLYLDSRPFSSITSILEAARVGVPVFASTPVDPGLALLGPSSPGLERAVRRRLDVDGYRRALAGLIADEGARHREGLQVQRDVLSFHAGAGWRRSVDAVYDALEGASGKSLAAEEDVFEQSALDIVVDSLYRAPAVRAVRGEIHDHLGAISYRARLRVLTSLRKKALPVHPLSWLPSSVYSSARGIFRIARHRLASARSDGQYVKVAG